MQMRVSGWRVAAAVGLFAGAQMLSGCGGFFVYPGSTTTGTSGSTSTDYVFVASSSSGQINGYSISSGTLTGNTNSPTTLSYIPTSMVVSPNNEYLFVASAGAIYSYSIGTGGALSFLASTTSNSESITVSPDGQWLLGIESTQGASSATYLDVYPITSGEISSTTVKQTSITSAGSVTITSPSQETIQIAPNGNFVAVALGTGGALVIPFTTSSGTYGSTTYPIGVPSGSTSGFSAVTIDANSYLYLVGSSSGSPVIESYSVNATTGIPNTAAISTLPVGLTPKWVTVSGNSAYVYVANSGAGTISGFTTSGGTLVSLGSAYSAPTSVSALGRDSTGSYLIALGFNTPSGLQPYTINSGGTLSEGTSVGSATGSIAAIAMSH